MLSKIHFYLGIGIVIIFLLTGQYMHHFYDHLQNMEPMSRALFRAGHLYILLFGLINAALGMYLQLATRKWAQLGQYIGSGAILIASGLVIYGFFTELPATQMERPITRYSLYLILFGVATHGIVYLRSSRNH